MEKSLPEGAGSSWLHSFLKSWLVTLDHGPSLLLLVLMIVAGAIGTAGCPFTIPTMLGVAGTSGADDISSGKRRSLWLGSAFSGGMWLGMILLGEFPGISKVDRTVGSNGRSFFFET